MFRQSMMAASVLLVAVGGCTVREEGLASREYRDAAGIVRLDNSPASHAGVREGLVTFREDGIPAELYVISGGESDRAVVRVAYPDGTTWDLSLEGAEAFEGHRVRAEVIRAVNEQQTDLAADVVERIADVVVTRISGGF